MNKDDRKELNHARALILEGAAIVETIADGEREKYDNMPEGFQQSERGLAFEEIADQLDTAKETLEQAVTEIEESESL